MFQVLSWRPRLFLCPCLRICNWHCLCIFVTLPFLNSSCHELSENVWVWGRGTVRCAAFNLFVFVTVFVFVFVFVIVIVFVFVSRCRLWIALVTSFQKMYGFGGVGLSEVQNSISELSVVGGGWVVGGGLDKRTSWSDLVGVRQKTISISNFQFKVFWVYFMPLYV